MSNKSLLANAIPISIDDHNFWPRLQAASCNSEVGLFKMTLPNSGPMYIVSMNHNIKMVPFVRNKKELFEATAKRASKENEFKVVINGPTYDLTLLGKVDAAIGSDAIPTSKTIPQGRIIHKEKLIGGQNSNMYWIANNIDKVTKYKFGKGYAPMDSDAALGNMGPLIINNMKFGLVNRYNPEQSKAKEIGPPKPKHAKHLTQRSSARYEDMLFRKDSKGKMILGYREDKSQLIILIQPDGTPGVDMPWLTHLILKMGLTSAVYLDGSDSVMLMIDDHFLVRQGSNKSETNITGIGFHY